MWCWERYKFCTSNIRHFRSLSAVLLCVCSQCVKTDIGARSVTPSVTVRLVIAAAEDAQVFEKSLLFCFFLLFWVCLFVCLCEHA